MEGCWHPNRLRVTSPGRGVKAFRRCGAPGSSAPRRAGRRRSLRLTDAATAGWRLRRTVYCDGRPARGRCPPSGVSVLRWSRRSTPRVRRSTREVRHQCPPPSPTPVWPTPTAPRSTGEAARRPRRYRSPREQDRVRWSGSHVYGDNRHYTVTVSVTDDDGGVGTRPGARRGSQRERGGNPGRHRERRVPGGEAIVSEIGSSHHQAASATDAGSDDLTFGCNIGPSTTYFNDGVGPDPFPSPWATFPCAAGDDTEVAFSPACTPSASRLPTTTEALAEPTSTKSWSGTPTRPSARLLEAAVLRQPEDRRRQPRRLPRHRRACLVGPLR